MGRCSPAGRFVLVGKLADCFAEDFCVQVAVPDPANGSLDFGVDDFTKAATHPYYKGDLDEVALYAGLLPVFRAQAHLDAA